MRQLLNIVPTRGRAIPLVCLLAFTACANPSTDEWTMRTRRPFILGGDSQASPPVVQGDAVLFCGGYFWNEWSELFALSVSTGQIRWHVPVGSCRGGPVVVGSTVVEFATQNHGTKRVSYGVDSQSGRTIWSRDVGDPIFSAALGDFVYLTVPNAPLRRVRAATGDVEILPLDGAPTRRMWVAGWDGGLLVGAGDSVWRVSSTSEKPSPITTFRSPLDDVEAVAAAGGVLIVEGRGLTNSLTAYALADGAVRWTRRGMRLLSAPRLLVGLPIGTSALAGRYVLVNAFGPNGTELQALDLESGNPVWTAHDGSFEAPSTDDAFVYAAGRRSVFVVDRRTGQIPIRMPSAEEIVTSPIRAGELILFGTIDGALHARRLPTVR